MTTETEVQEAIAPVENAEPETVTEQQVSDEASEAEDVEPEKPATEEAPGAKKFDISMQKRMDALTADKYKARGEAEQYKKQNEALLLELAKHKTNSDPDKPGIATEEIDRIATEKAKEMAQHMAAAQNYNEKCERIFESGTKEFPDFDASVKNLALLGQTYQNALPIIVDTTNDPHKILHHLSQNLEDANRILSLPPVKQAAELARLEQSLGREPAGKQISNAPKPATTVSGAKPVTPKFDASNTKLSTAEWVAKREAELKAKGKKSWA